MRLFVPSCTPSLCVDGKLTACTPRPVFLVHTRTRTHPQRFLSHARNGLDAFGLIWFVVGNMWLFGGDVEMYVCPSVCVFSLFSLA